jgi:hypothetical protein
MKMITAQSEPTRIWRRGIGATQTTSAPAASYSALWFTPSHLSQAHVDYWIREVSAGRTEVADERLWVQVEPRMRIWPLFSSV